MKKRLRSFMDILREWEEFEREWLETEQAHKTAERQHHRAEKKVRSGLFGSDGRGERRDGWGRCG